MKSVIAIGAIAALFIGVAIGVQSTISSRLGALIGPIRTGLFTNLVGGALAALILLGVALVQGSAWWQLSRPSLVFLLVAGALGVLIISGVSFSFQRVGVAAGVAAVILGQMLVSVIVDSLGWGGTAPIALSLRRIVGLGVLAIAVLLLLPRSSQ